MVVPNMANILDVVLTKLGHMQARTLFKKYVLSYFRDVLDVW